MDETSVRASGQSPRIVDGPAGARAIAHNGEHQFTLEVPVTMGIPSSSSFSFYAPSDPSLRPRMLVVLIVTQAVDGSYLHIFRSTRVEIGAPSRKRGDDATRERGKRGQESIALTAVHSEYLTGTYVTNVAHKL